MSWIYMNFYLQKKIVRFFRIVVKLIYLYISRTKQVNMYFVFTFKIYLVKASYMISCKIINKIAPGIPNIPTKIEVKKLRPIENPHAPPIKLIIYIKTPPKTEFKINLKILFNGKIKILPNKNRKTIQAKNVITLLPSICPPSLFLYFYVWNRTNILTLYMETNSALPK